MFKPLFEKLCLFVFTVCLAGLLVIFQSTWLFVVVVADVFE